MKTIYLNSRIRCDINTVLKNIQVNVKQYDYIIHHLPPTIINTTPVSLPSISPLEALQRNPVRERKKVLAYLYLQCLRLDRHDLLQIFVRDL
jgi:hypothetical protein